MSTNYQNNAKYAALIVAVALWLLTTIACFQYLVGRPQIDFNKCPLCEQTTTNKKTP
jgi:hypothetical protein